LQVMFGWKTDDVILDELAENRITNEFASVTFRSFHRISCCSSIKSTNNNNTLYSIIPNISHYFYLPFQLHGSGCSCYLRPPQSLSRPSAQR
jgi:hypothetical protein